MEKIYTNVKVRCYVEALYDAQHITKIVDSLHLPSCLNNIIIGYDGRTCKERLDKHKKSIYKEFYRKLRYIYYTLYKKRSNSSYNFYESRKYEIMEFNKLYDDGKYIENILQSNNIVLNEFYYYDERQQSYIYDKLDNAIDIFLDNLVKIRKNLDSSNQVRIMYLYSDITKKYIRITEDASKTKLIYIREFDDNLQYIIV